MQTRAPMFWLISIIIVLIILVMWHRGISARDINLTASPTNSLVGAVSVASDAIAGGLPQTNKHLESFAPNRSTNPEKSSQPNKRDQMKQGLTRLNDLPIVFYGKLEDQLGDPVAGAKIAAGVRIYNGIRSTLVHLSATSDANGRFQIDGGKGESLGLMPEKDGYVLATTSTFFKYSYMYPDHFTPDPDNPTIIKMWKLQGAEPLLTIDQRYKLPYTAVPINIDLLGGRIVPQGGDLKITVNRPGGEISEQNPQDWGIEVEAVDGGVIETSGKTEAVTFAAPESGYRLSDTVTASSNHLGISVIQLAFFVKSRGGQIYSRLGFSFGINMMPNENMNILINGVANTNGSRNWEATASQ